MQLSENLSLAPRIRLDGEMANWGIEGLSYSPLSGDRHRNHDDEANGSDDIAECILECIEFTVIQIYISQHQ